MLACAVCIFSTNSLHAVNNSSYVCGFPAGLLQAAMASHWKCVCTIRSVIVLLALLLPVLEARVGKRNCISNFPELEEEFLQRKQNLDSLNEAFFPPNRQLSIVVDVYFYFLLNISSPPTSEGSTLEDNSIDEDDQPTLEHLELGYYDYKFRWAASSVVTFTAPDLLEILSLYTFFDSTKTAKVIIPPVCGSLPLGKRIAIDGHSSHECSNKAVGRVEKLLNRLTTLVSLSILNNLYAWQVVIILANMWHIMQRSLTTNDSREA